ncbi:MAG: efflux transporter outer membrane subunit [Gammaproteobacteria bacterium]|nr:efflux transporter outer membrane subunit [Gammaproteobacteria bacterium]
MDQWCRFKLACRRCTAAVALPRRGMSLLRVLPVAAGILVQAACSSLAGPEYERPETATKPAWSDETAIDVSAAETVRPDWWRNFGDDYLDGLVDTAISQNIDIKVLAARSEVAGAAISQAEALRLPTIGAAAGANVQTSAGLGTSTQYSAAASLNWELDIWGKFKKGVQAQEAGYFATEADWRAGYLSMVSDVSTTYFRIRQFDEQIAQQQAMIDKNRQILAIYGAMLREGLIPETRVMQQKAEVGRLQNQLLELKRVRQLSENAIATLLGIPAGEFHVPPGSLRSEVRLMAVPAGLPSDLLSRRPDIIAAEFRVLQAYDLVGQARLARLPSITLTARGGNSSLELTDLLASWSVGFLPRIDIPIFDPNVRAQLKVNEARTRLAEEEYKRTVIRAFEEVENTLVNLASHRAQKAELEMQRENLRVVSQQIQRQLKEGMVSQLEWFESERSLLRAEQELLQNHQLILSDTVELYKALGGGWPPVTVGSSG